MSEFKNLPTFLLLSSESNRKGIGLLVYSLKPGERKVINERRAGRQTVRVSKGGVKRPVADRRVVDGRAAFPFAVVIKRIVEVN